jgi:hypothetical protein
VAQAAAVERFGDVAGQVESLRQQLVTARSKLDLFAERHDRAGAVH